MCITLPQAGEITRKQYPSPWASPRAQANRHRVLKQPRRILLLGAATVRPLTGKLCSDADKNASPNRPPQEQPLSQQHQADRTGKCPFGNRQPDSHALSILPGMVP